MTELERRANEMRSDIVREGSRGRAAGIRADRCRAPTSSRRSTSAACSSTIPRVPTGTNATASSWRRAMRLRRCTRAVLKAERGYLPARGVAHAAQSWARTCRPPRLEPVPGVEVSTGSPGQGSSTATARGWPPADGKDQDRVRPARRRRNARKARWRPLRFAAHRGLTTSWPVDRNSLQIDGNTARRCDPGDLVGEVPGLGREAGEVTATTSPRSWEVLHAAAKRPATADPTC